MVTIIISLFAIGPMVKVVLTTVVILFTLIDVPRLMIMLLQIPIITAKSLLQNTKFKLFLMKKILIPKTMVRWCWVLT